MPRRAGAVASACDLVIKESPPAFDIFPEAKVGNSTYMPVGYFSTRSYVLNKMVESMKTHMKQLVVPVLGTARGEDDSLLRKRLRHVSEVFPGFMPAIASRHDDEALDGTRLHRIHHLVRQRHDLGMGEASTTVWTCDLSTEYVVINGEYRT